jgi:hypothetical protein
MNCDDCGKKGTQSELNPIVWVYNTPGERVAYVCGDCLKKFRDKKNLGEVARKEDKPAQGTST